MKMAKSFTSFQKKTFLVSLHVSDLIRGKNEWQGAAYEEGDTWVDESHLHQDKDNDILYACAILWL
jgi:hypothetical protein